MLHLIPFHHHTLEGSIHMLHADKSSSKDGALTAVALAPTRLMTIRLHLQVALRGNVSNKGAGALTLHLTSHDIPQLGFVLLVPAVSKGISQLRQRFGSSY